MLEIAQQLNKDAPEGGFTRSRCHSQSLFRVGYATSHAGGKSAAQYFKSSSSLQLTIDYIPFAAYMVN